MNTLIPFGLSVVVPSFERKEMLLEAIQSLQTAQPHLVEVIVVDDASTESPAAYLPTKNASAVTVRLYEQKLNRGAQAARNLGIRRARFRYIAFLDSDDLFYPEKIDILLAVLADDGIDMVFHPVEGMPFYARVGSIWWKHLRGTIPLWMLLSLLNPIPTPALAIRKERRLGPPTLRRSEDWAFLLNYVRPDTRVLFLDAKLGQVRRAPSSTGGLSADVWKMRQGEFIARQVLLRRSGARSALRWLIGSICGLVRVFFDMVRLRYLRSKS